MVRRSNSTSTTTTRKRSKSSSSKQDTNAPTTPTDPSPPPSPRRRRGKMNNADNHAAVEIKRKQATEEARYDHAERGESKSSPRNFEKPDKPDYPKDDEERNAAASLSALPPQDLKNVGLLALLYLLQGVPVGLAFGSIPFLLKAHLSYGQVGVFSLASYPYSMKLLWSPIVDAVYSRQLGRRKSWIVPIQAASGVLLLWLGTNIEQLLAMVLSLGRIG